MQPEAHTDSGSKTVTDGARFITYMNYVFFYTRFIFIYVLSALLEIMGLSAAASAVVTMFAVALTVIIVVCVISIESRDWSTELRAMLPAMKKTRLSCHERVTTPELIYLFLGVEYIFDIGWMFGFSRQCILTAYTQSHAIAFLSVYQPVIFLTAAFLALWLAYVKSTVLNARAERQNAIFYQLDMAKLEPRLQRPDRQPCQHKLWYACIALAVSCSLFAGFQYFLSGSLDLTQAYGISYYLLTFLSTVSLSYVLWGHKADYWNLIWVGFMSISAVLGVIYFGKVVFMALLGHIVTDFYSMHGIGIFFGCAVASSFLYGQILQHFAMNQIKIATIYTKIATITSDDGQMLPQQAQLSPYLRNEHVHDLEAKP